MRSIFINRTSRQLPETPKQCQGSRLLVLMQGVSDYEVIIQQADYRRAHAISIVPGESQYTL